jgi:hypothetical protein
MIKTGTACVLLFVGAVAGVVPVAASSPSASPATPSMPAASGTAITTVGHDRDPLAAGTYRYELDRIPSGGEGFPAIEITVPDGWENLDGWGLHRGRFGAAPVAIQFWDVGQVYRDPCQWDGTLFEPGPSVAELTAALVDRPMRNATPPVDVTLDGRDGKYLEWSVPADLDFADCDADGADHYFESWAGAVDGDRYQQGPGQVDRLWILDVDGRRLVIDAFDMPSATDAERQELLDVVASIRFEDGAP